jgi:hypothetical protein
VHFSQAYWDLTKTIEYTGEKAMVLLAAVAGLILCSCILAAVRSKRTGETSKVRTLKIK